MSLRIALVSLLLSSLSLAEPLKELRIDYATYNPSSLVLKKFGWLEEAVGKDGTKVTWLYSEGSNKANELLSSGSADLASTAGAAALLARTNGVPLKIVYVYSKPEWTALVVPKGSPLKSVADLKGKKIAVTKGTDPYFFLLQSLAAAGLSPSDVEIVNLQHADGKTALERGDVDAWSGLDPFMAQAVLENGSRLLYRNPDFTSYGTLNAREDFAAAHPEAIKAVLNSYEEARKWAQAHPAELAALLAREAKVSPSVAQAELERTDLTMSATPGEAQHKVLTTILPIAVADGDIKSAQAGQAALASIIEPKFADQAS